MFRIRLDAPFAAFRPYTAGWYRPTAKFLTPSAAYGLLLNVAGIDTRLREEHDGHDGKQPTTYMRSDLPTLRIAVGAPADTNGRLVLPREQIVYQQLHNYPVGASGKDRASDAHGSKYNITPVRRELLTGLRALILVRADDDVEDRIRRGLAGTLQAPRYGLPFLGDNSFLPDRLEPASENVPVFWYERLAGDLQQPRPHTTRMTIWIDRADMSRTLSALFAPTTSPAVDPTDTAWVDVGPSIM
ncbi:MAG: type I-MYXAN CRISPR-associated protein Cas5/Cmx5/DevS [Planctomycetota bacterium]